MATPPLEDVPLPLQNTRLAFYQLGQRVNLALHTQIGDSARLEEQSHAAMRLLDAVHQVSGSLLHLLRELINHCPPFSTRQLYLHQSA